MRDWSAGQRVAKAALGWEASGKGATSKEEFQECLGDAWFQFPLSPLWKPAVKIFFLRASVMCFLRLV